MTRFRPTELPLAPIFLLVARLLRDKGVREFCEAAAEVKLQKLQQELTDKASDIARVEGNLKAREASLAKRTTDLTWQEEDLAFREEMWARRNKLLDELELEAEERRERLEGKMWALEEQVRQFQAEQAAQAM